MNLRGKGNRYLFWNILAKHRKKYQEFEALSSFKLKDKEFYSPEKFKD